MGRRSTGWLVLAVAALAGGAAVGVAGDSLVGEPAPTVHVRWRDAVTAEARAGIERELRLDPVEHHEATTWRYALRDTSARNVRRLVQHPDIVDTHYIDRDRFAVRGDAPSVAATAGWLGTTAPGAARAIRDYGTWTLLALAAAAALLGLRRRPAPAAPARVVHS